MGNRISPFIQKFKRRLAGLILTVVGQNILPKQDPQSVEVGTNVTRIWVTVVEFSSVNELGSQDSSEVARTDKPNELVNAFGMKASAEPLKLRRQQHGIRMVDLLSCIPSATSGSTYHSMRGHDLVQSFRPNRSPSFKRMGWHD